MFAAPIHVSGNSLNVTLSEERIRNKTSRRSHQRNTPYATRVIRRKPAVRELVRLTAEAMRSCFAVYFFKLETCTKRQEMPCTMRAIVHHAIRDPASGMESNSRPMISTVLSDIFLYYRVRGTERADLAALFSAVSQVFRKDEKSVHNLAGVHRRAMPGPASAC
jgi:hypothetical protein